MTLFPVVHVTLEWRGRYYAVVDVAFMLVAATVIIEFHGAFHGRISQRPSSGSGSGCGRLAFRRSALMSAMASRLTANEKTMYVTAPIAVSVSNPWRLPAGAIVRARLTTKIIAALATADLPTIQNSRAISIPAYGSQVLNCIKNINGYAIAHAALKPTTPNCTPVKKAAIIAQHVNNWFRAASFAFPNPCKVGGINCPNIRRGITMASTCRGRVTGCHLPPNKTLTISGATTAMPQKSGNP